MTLSSRFSYFVAAMASTGNNVERRITQRSPRSAPAAVFCGEPPGPPPPPGRPSAASHSSLGITRASVGKTASMHASWRRWSKSAHKSDRSRS